MPLGSLTSISKLYLGYKRENDEYLTDQRVVMALGTVIDRGHGQQDLATVSH